MRNTWPGWMRSAFLVLCLGVRLDLGAGGVADGMSAENEPAADTGQFLREVANADEGWSERYGGPEGIAAGP